MGREKVLTEDKIEIICRAIADGASDKDAFTLAGISKAVFYKEKAGNQYFQDRIKRAKDEFDEWWQNEMLEVSKKSLKSRILGGTYKKTVTVYVTGPDGNPRIKERRIEENEVPPSDTAVIFALCNRDPEHWKQRVEQDVKAEIKQEKQMDLSKVPTELLEEVAKHILDA